MWLSRLGVRHVRIVVAAELQPSPGLNIIAGDNGSGKTSLLEAIHILSYGRSFRTSKSESVVSRGQVGFRVTGKVAGAEGEGTALGIERGVEGMRARVGGQEAKGLWELAEALPVIALHPGSHELVSGAPGLRRQFLDWGAFQDNPRFMESWRRWRRALEQRNLGLRRAVSSRELVAWEQELAEAAEAVDAGRAEYVESLRNELAGFAGTVRELGEVELVYQRGWARDVSLQSAMRASEARDRQLGHTQPGPHRAELEIRVGSDLAARVASRGQEKVLAVLLKLAQARVFRDRHGQTPVILVDDLASELDSGHREAVLARLVDLGGQVFVSSILAEDVPQDGWAEVGMFHVKHGEVRELV